MKTQRAKLVIITGAHSAQLFFFYSYTKKRKEGKFGFWVYLRFRRTSAAATTAIMTTAAAMPT
jgi:hypothetical protein